MKSDKKSRKFLRESSNLFEIRAVKFDLEHVFNVVFHVNGTLFLPVETQAAQSAGVLLTLEVNSEKRDRIESEKPVGTKLFSSSYLNSTAGANMSRQRETRPLILGNRHVFRMTKLLSLISLISIRLATRRLEHLTSGSSSSRT